MDGRIGVGGSTFTSSSRGGGAYSRGYSDSGISAP